MSEARSRVSEALPSVSGAPEAVSATPPSLAATLTSTTEALTSAREALPCPNEALTSTPDRGIDSLNFLLGTQRLTPVVSYCEVGPQRENDFAGERVRSIGWTAK